MTAPRPTASLDAASFVLMTMPYLIIGGERYALPIGETFLGGAGDDALPAPELSHVTPAAMIAVLPDGMATIRRIGLARVVAGEAPLGEDVVPLCHGLRLDVSGVSLIFGDMQENGSTTDLPGVTDGDLAMLDALAPGEPTADTGGRVELTDGRVVAIPATGLTIGRDPDCGLPLTGKDVSRRHATITPSLQGYRLTDSSANGTWVNQRRVEGSALLGYGDTIRVGDEEFRFHADRTTLEPIVPRARESAVSGAALLPDAAPARPAAALFATLEIVNEGVNKGSRFRIERPVAHVGRGAQNDVRLRDDSVSGSHATLSRRGGRWFVLDLGSTNGTYVDGERVGERELTGPSELRFGNVKLSFRPIGGSGDDEASTRAVVGVTDEALATPPRKPGR